MPAMDLSSISSLEDLQDIARTLERGTLRHYKDLAELMKYGHNTETAASFEALAAQKTHFQGAEHPPTDTVRTVAGNADEPGTEIADTPYLMTPYQALRLAVYNEEQAFKLFTRIAAETENPAIREQAESLARNQIQHIAEFRLQRRRAFRAQKETSVGRIARERMLKTPNDVSEIRRKIESAILDVMEKECRNLKGSLPEETAVALRLLVQEIGGTDCKDAMQHIETAPADKGDPQQTFLALRSLLQEIEAAFEVFMAPAETGASEDTVQAAQEAAQKYISLLALIRGCLDDLIEV